MTNQNSKDNMSGNEAYDEDLATDEFTQEPSAVKPQQQTIDNKKTELKRNLKSVFGSGIGKISIVMIAVVILMFGTIGIRGLTKPKANENNSTVTVATPPRPKNRVEPVTEDEFQRRAEVSAQEANSARDEGSTYQPGFDPIIGNNQNYDTSGYAMFPDRLPPELNAQGGNNQNTQNAGYNNITALPTNVRPAAASAQSEQQYQQRIQQDLAREIAERDKYITSIRNIATSELSNIFDNRNGLNSIGLASSSVYYNPSPKEEYTATDSQIPIITAGNNTNTGAGTPTMDGQQTNAINNGKTALIKTGEVMYATLNSEVNTDKGGDVIATIRGGEWNGSIIIGKVEQANQNIQLRFTTLAPPKDDPRKTMSINAVALREEDASQGMATKIDHHTLSRYTALAASSLLSGYGNAYRDTAGTTVVTNGGIVTSSEDPSDKRVIANVVGELGQSLSQAARRGFDRPSTYSTPARTGFMLFFLADVQQQ